MLRIGKVPGSNLGPETGYSEVLRNFSQFVKQIPVQIHTLVHGNFLSKSLLAFYPLILLYAFLAIRSVGKQTMNEIRTR
jgi:hypothetical protein